MSDIGIVGAGISGLTLALRLQQLGIETTVYTNKDADALRVSRLPNSVARFEPTLARERALGVDHWGEEDGYAMRGMHADIGGQIRFFGRMDGDVRAVDFRMYLSTLLEDYAARGGRVVVGPTPTVADITASAGRHDLLVAAVGRSSIDELFPRRADRSPYAAAQRQLCAGLYTGIALPDPIGLSANLVPGVGEIFQMPMLTSDGVASVLLFESVPGGPLDAVTTMSYADDPRAFASAVRGALQAFAPLIAERLQNDFALRGPNDILQGAVTPTVRHAYARVSDDRFAIAIGDAWITNDPVTGQGANLGSHCAFALADAIGQGDPLDETFCARVEDEMWRYAEPVCAWTNAFLQPPPPHAIELLATAAAHQEVADGWVQMFADPTRMWATLSDPGATASFIAERTKSEVASAAVAL